MTHLERVRKDATIRPSVCATNRLLGVGIAIQTRGGPLAEKYKHDYEDRTTTKKENDPQTMPARLAAAAAANTPRYKTRSITNQKQTSKTRKK